MKIALAGNPNSGKTTLYNKITGSNERVGNWAGVTVESKHHAIKKSYNTTGESIDVVDLPGMYSMSAYTSEEGVTSSFVTNQNVDVIVNIVDATNLSRSLFLTTQLLEIGVPVIIALNKSDLHEKKGISIDTAKLAKSMGCPVVKTISTHSDKDNGLNELISQASKLKSKGQSTNFVADETKNAEEIDKDRFDFVDSIVSDVESRTKSTSKKNTQDKVDDILAHKWLGLPIFAVVMWGIFSISQEHVGPWIAGYLEEAIGIFTEWVAGLIEGASPFLQSLILDGIIGGVGAVLGFLPLVMVMYFLIALFEDLGYMARVAVVMDRFLKKVGLSGKSIIPFVIGTGCAIPGVMAARTIRDDRERNTTAMITPFMPCGAKMPVIALFGALFFEDASWVTTLMYFVGIALIFVGALIAKAITGYKAGKSFFIIELPEYKVPSIIKSGASMFSRAWSFIVKAGTIILLCNAAVHLMQNFDFALNYIGDNDALANTSILHAIASPIAILLVPLGFGTWQLAAAVVTGFIAKENVVGTLAVVFAINADWLNRDDLEVVTNAGDIAGIMGITPLIALGYLMFNLYTPPCFAAIGAMNSEMTSMKWLFGGIGLQLSTAYVLTFFVYQIGSLVTTGSLGEGFLPGLIAVAVMIAVYVILILKGKTKTTKRAIMEHMTA